VAIKEMNQDGLNPQELAEASAAFEREALLLSDLTHANLPRIHDHFSERGRPMVNVSLQVMQVFVIIQEVLMVQEVQYRFGL
jgi:serine/threonine protein kinase